MVQGFHSKHLSSFQSEEGGYRGNRERGTVRPPPANIVLFPGGCLRNFFILLPEKKLC